MEKGFRLLLACILLLTPTRVGESASPSPQSPGEGELHVYLQPLPSEAEGLAFSIGALSAVDDAGAGHPLTLSFTAVAFPEARRQRFIGSVRLREGHYAGLSMVVREASRQRAGVRSDLLVPDAAVSVDVPFLVSRARALVLWLEFRAGDSLPAAGADFRPAFVAYEAPRPMRSLMGFVSNPSTRSLTVFDKKRREAAAVVLTGSAPAGMALDQREGRLFVACPDEDEILVLDVVSADIVERTRVFPGDRPREVALTPDGRMLVSVNPGSNSVSVFDASPLTRLERLDVGDGPGSLAIDPTGQRAFVFNTLSNTVSVVDLPRRSVVATMSLDFAPSRGQFSARGDRLFVVHERSPYVTVLDPERLTVIGRERLRASGTALKVDARRGWLSVGSPTSNAVDFYEPNTLLPVDTLKVAGGVSHMTIDSEDNRLYLVSPKTGRLVVGSAADRRVVTEIDVGQGAFWVAVMGER